MRTYDFDNDFTPRELAEALRDAGFPRDATLSAIINGSIEDVDHEVNLTVTLGEDEILDDLHEDAIIEAYRGLADDAMSARDIEDGLGYALKGDKAMSRAMFARVFEGGNLQAVERALS
ncbi:hypothetical protein BRX36_10620 [Sphingomonas sp. S-NIH.Pt1_0416]|uniref:hypothetical protein n=1 Tax=Sphingomonas sp. S-NIH.Pt1_0416 TaxID=1920123 RepID=UPI000F7DF74B|nr:hypothetical protein [Sphingomonas sp. S-NIH.Pt1_0416]RSU65489.1 hypothetical protein BRX36_10620 [Sphingomonas sp. S-NIH.Pt1_0416]